MYSMVMFKSRGELHDTSQGVHFITFSIKKFK